MARKFDSALKSLLHFDYYYVNEPNDGLYDEISSETWTRADGVKFYGSAFPCDYVASFYPKFGYRCFYSTKTSTILTATNKTGAFNISNSIGYEFSFFMRAHSGSGGILYLRDGTAPIFSLELSPEGCFMIDGKIYGSQINFKQWYYVIVRFANGKITLYVDGEMKFAIDNSKDYAPTTLELGGFMGEMDEFCARTGASEKLTLSEPRQGRFDINDINSFGTGAQGDAVISSSGRVNSYAQITAASGNTITISNWNIGSAGTIKFTPQTGTEIFIHVSAPRNNNYSLLGCYTFARIKSISDKNITLEEPVTDFSLPDALKNYYVQIITVPNFKNLTINASTTISPLTYSNSNGGGIVVLRASENARVNGKIISSGFGRNREDLLQLTHSKIIKNFVISSGGNIFIAAKEFYANSNARIGASWDGSQTFGAYKAQSAGGNGGAGYGGAGGSDTDTNCTGGNGGVGGGGGGQDGGGTNWNKTNKGFDAGTNDTTGGAYSVESVLRSGRIGGTQGKNPNGVQGGGGGAGGSGSNEAGDLIPSGSNVIILAEKFSCDEAAVSTGGAGGNSGNGTSQGGGGGTGFCYIAAKELI